AALLSTLCEGFGRDFTYVPRQVGYGLGTRVRESPPNAVRVVACEMVDLVGEPIVVLETNLDDVTGQEVGRLIERCLAAGAFDVVAYPVTMKKGRPGQVIEVLAGPAEAATIEELLLIDSTALGVRRTRASRRILAREALTLTTSFGAVRAKAATLPDGSRRIAPEFAEIDRLAREHALPLAEVRRRLASELGG
ncbi:MAG: DUF111 family protein, partial [Planctomycetes bacterium]|nr:DUF111 family protein [Planctomycetota bacterium]